MHGRSMNSYATEVAVFLKRKVGSSARALELIEQNESIVKKAFRTSVHPLAVAGLLAVKGKDRGERDCGAGFL